MGNKTAFPNKGRPTGAGAALPAPRAVNGRDEQPSFASRPAKYHSRPYYYVDPTSFPHL